MNKDKVIHYPVIEEDFASGVYHPLKQFPEDHPLNKNRRSWSLKEKEELMKNELGFKHAMPSKSWIWAVAYEPSLDMKMIDSVPSTAHEWGFAKVVAMGSEAFDTDAFPTGAPVTYNDYFYFFPTRASMMKLDNGKKLIVIHDTAILGAVDHPSNLTNNFHTGE